MDINKALEIISALSDGVNPETGEELSNDSYFNQPKVIRALFIAKQSIEKVIKTEKRKSDLPENAGKPWKTDEDEALSANFDCGMTMEQLSSHHKRTKGSITSRLVRLGKISDRSNVHIRELDIDT